MSKIIVAIGQFEHRSDDDGTNWVRSQRHLPAKYSPVVHGDIDPLCLPVQSEDFRWDFITVLSSGFGIIAGHKNLDLTHSIAEIYVSTDDGKNWRRQDPRTSVSFLRKAVQQVLLISPSWPVERFESLVVPSPDSAVLAWSDPWLFDCPQSHVISTADQGNSWRYCCLGDTNPYLAADQSGRLFASNDGFFLESDDGGISWRKQSFLMDWPKDCDSKRVALLRHLIFTTPRIGYALVVHWPQNMTREMTPDVGLLKTTDKGLRWSHLAVFDGPDVGDVNERHVTSLRVF